MAITHRNGDIKDYDSNKLTPFQWAFPSDGSIRCCVAPGVEKILTTREDVQQLLTSSPGAYSALQQLLIDLTNNPSELTNILNNIANLQSGKLDKTGDSSNNIIGMIDTQETDTDIAVNDKHSTFIGKIIKRFTSLALGIGAKIDKTSIVQSAEISDANKVPSSVVTAALATLINSLSNVVSGINSNLPYASKNVIYNDAVADSTYRRIDLNVNGYDGKINGYFRTLTSGLGILLCTLPSDSRPKKSTYCTISSATSSGFATIQTDGKVLADISATGAIYVITGTFVK
jgi:hypothetical protein